MELSGSTFVLEIINFLVLLWLLQRFFYKPLQAVIARRRAGIEQQVADAEAMQHQARDLQSQYENRLSHWEAERQSAREALQQEIDRERARQQADLRQMLEQERQKAEVSQQRQLLERQLHLERQALQQGSRFAARLLEQCVGPELEARLLDMLLDALPQLPAEQQQSLREREAEHSQPVEVISAYPLSEEARSRLQQGLNQLLGKPGECRFRQDPSLLAGLRVSIGPWVFRASVRDELQSFAGLALTTGNADLSCDRPDLVQQTEDGNG